jgi:phage protein D
MTSVAYASAPRITLSSDLKPAVMADLLDLEVNDHIHGFASLRATFANWGFTGHGQGSLYLDRSNLDFGAPITVGFGPDTGTVLFAGAISAINADFPEFGPGTVTVCAEDTLQKFRMTRRTRTFENSSTADIAQSLASDHGLTAQADLDGPTRKVVNQLNVSDLALLRALAHADGAELWLDGQTLHVQRRADRTAAPLTFTYGGDLRSFTVRADLAHQVTDVAVCGWSVADKDAIKELGDASALGSELGAGDTSGSPILEHAFGERHECIVVAEPLDRDDARSRARAAYLDRARRFVTGTGTTDGTPAVQPGVVVTLAGLVPLFNGDYRVVRTRHHFDVTAGGYRTEFDVERAGIGAAR